jgi:hypothetical protein
MAIGKGRYDDICTEVRKRTEADGVIMIVLRGKHGSGFTVQADMRTQLLLPDILDEVANGIRASLDTVEKREQFVIDNLEEKKND